MISPFLSGGNIEHQGGVMVPVKLEQFLLSSTTNLMAFSPAPFRGVAQQFQAVLHHHFLCLVF